MNRAGAQRRANGALDSDRPSPVESAVLLEAIDDALLELELLRLLLAQALTGQAALSGLAALSVDRVEDLHRFVHFFRRTESDNARRVPPLGRLARFDTRETVAERDVGEFATLALAELDRFGGGGPAGGRDRVPFGRRGAAQDAHRERRGDEDLLDAGFDKEGVELAQGEVLQLVVAAAGGNVATRSAFGFASSDLRNKHRLTVWWQYDCMISIGSR